MAKKNPTKKPRTINQQFASLERIVRTGFRQTDRRFRQVDGRFQQIDGRFRQIDGRFRQIDGRFRQIDGRFRQIDGKFRQIDRRFNIVGLEFRALRKEMNEKFAVVEDRIDRLATHVDGFMKLHETLDIELTVMKQQ